jgi:hypothetical protein
LSEAQTRQTESTMILQYIDRAKLIVPKGQVVLTSKEDLENTLLADNDTSTSPSSPTSWTSAASADAQHARLAEGPRGQ